MQNSDEEWTLSLDPDDDEQQITQPHLTDKASLSNNCFKKMTSLIRETLPKTGYEDRENGKYNLVYTVWTSNVVPAEIVRRPPGDPLRRVSGFFGW